MVYHRSAPGPALGDPDPSPQAAEDLATRAAPPLFNPHALNLLGEIQEAELRAWELVFRSPLRGGSC